MEITSIWNNPFYNIPPIPKWSWELDFQSLFVNNDTTKENTIDYAESLNKAAVSCQWGGRNGNLIPVYYAGVEARLPGRSQPTGDLTIKFNENTKMNVTKILEELYHAEITCDSYFENKEGYAFNKNFNKVDRSIRLLIHRPDVVMSHNSNDDDYSKNLLCEITYHNCILYKLDPIDLSYETEDEVISHNATFGYDYMSVKGNQNAYNTINKTCAMHSSSFAI